MESARMDGNINEQLALAIKRLSAAKYGRPKAAVEKDIFARLKTIETPKTAFGAGKKAGIGSGDSFGVAQRPPQQPAMAQQAAKPGSSSFLDEWLDKRKTDMATKNQLLVKPRTFVHPNKQSFRHRPRYIHLLSESRPLSLVLHRLFLSRPMMLRISLCRSVTKSQLQLKIIFRLMLQFKKVSLIVGR